MKSEKTLEILKALGDKTRLEIVKSLYRKTECLEELSEKFSLTPATLSFHMKKLENAGLITKVREQYFTNFSLIPDIYRKTLGEIISIDEIPDTSDERFNKKVIATFMTKGKINQFPRQHKKRKVLLKEIAKHFKVGKIYSESEVNTTIENIFPDYCTLRRMLIDEGLMERNNGKYQIKTQEEIKNSFEQDKEKNMKTASERKRELKLMYKETKIKMGVYKIENTTNGKIYLGTTQNIPGRYNRHEFLLKMGLHINKELQADWNEFGKECFTFDLLEELKEPSDSIQTNNKLLDKLKSKWLKKLEPFGDRGYNRKNVKSDEE